MYRGNVKWGIIISYISSTIAEFEQFLMKMMYSMKKNLYSTISGIKHSI